MDTTTLEAIHTLARAVHDMSPTDNAVRDLLWSLEAELHELRDDPLQLRAALVIRGRHAEYVMEEVG